MDLLKKNIFCTQYFNDRLWRARRAMAERLGMWKKSVVCWTFPFLLIFCVIFFCFTYGFASPPMVETPTLAASKPCSLRQSHIMCEAARCRTIGIRQHFEFGGRVWNHAGAKGMGWDGCKFRPSLQVCIPSGHLFCHWNTHTFNGIAILQLFTHGCVASQVQSLEAMEKKRMPHPKTRLWFLLPWCPISRTHRK